MSATAALVAVVVVAASTYLMRASLIVLLAGVTIPPSVERALRYVGPATRKPQEVEGWDAIPHGQ